MNALRGDPDSREATMKDFEAALEEVNPTATEDNLDMYQQMTQKMNDIDTEDDTPDYYA